MLSASTSVATKASRNRGTSSWAVRWVVIVWEESKNLRVPFRENSAFDGPWAKLLVGYGGRTWASAPDARSAARRGCSTTAASELEELGTLLKELRPRAFPRCQTWRLWSPCHSQTWEARPVDERSTRPQSWVKMWMRRLRHPGSPMRVACPEASADRTRELMEPPSRCSDELSSMVGVTSPLEAATRPSKVK